MERRAGCFLGVAAALGSMLLAACGSTPSTPPEGDPAGGAFDAHYNFDFGSGDVSNIDAGVEDASCDGPCVTTVPLYGSCSARGHVCEPNAMCFADDVCGDKICVRRCTTDGECAGGATCSVDIGDGLICDVAPVACNPVGDGLCADGKQCFVLGLSGDATGCDCPGSVPLGGVCGGVRDCAPGLLCAPAAEVHFCHQVCRQGEQDCPLPLGCNPYPGSFKWGWCG
jgi:hypothetical protein